MMFGRSVTRTRFDLLQDCRADHLEPDEVEGLARHGVAGRLQDLDGVIDRLVIASRARDTRVVVVVGDLLESRLVLSDALERHAFEQLRKRVVRSCVTACWSGGDSRREQRGEQHERGGERRAARPRAHRDLLPGVHRRPPGLAAGRSARRWYGQCAVPGPVRPYPSSRCASPSSGSPGVDMHVS